MPADNMVLFRQRREADRPPPRLSRHLHVPAEIAERICVRLASASIDRLTRERRECVHGQGQGEALSPFGRAYLAGLLEHARASTVFTTPTINGYKRYRSYSLAPDRAIWGRDNRGVMIRVLGGPGDTATRLENRIGEPAANPYLYMASQILSGLDGVDRKLDPGPSADTPYETKAALLPKSLREAVFALQDDPFFRGAGGGVRGLLRPHQECGDRAVSGRSVGLGAPRIFRDVLRAASSLPANAGTHNHRCNSRGRPSTTALETTADGVWVPAFAGTTTESLRLKSSEIEGGQSEACPPSHPLHEFDGYSLRFAHPTQLKSPDTGAADPAPRSTALSSRSTPSGRAR